MPAGIAPARIAPTSAASHSGLFCPMRLTPFPGSIPSLISARAVRRASRPYSLHVMDCQPPLRFTRNAGLEPCFATVSARTSCTIVAMRGSIVRAGGPLLGWACPRGATMKRPLLQIAVIGLLAACSPAGTDGTSSGAPPETVPPGEKPAIPPGSSSGQVDPPKDVPPTDPWNPPVETGPVSFPYTAYRCGY